METHKRSIAKTVTWRVVAVVVTMIAVYVYSGDVRESVVVSLSANVIKMFLYYLHERVWNRLDFGRAKPPEYQI
ncbi:MAG: DUF2061 domain-containing protein [Candidatus Omnitrophota bacterium]